MSVAAVTQTEFRGREPVVLQGDVQDRMISLLTSGLSVYASCREVGVSRDTFWRWMRLGEREGAREPYRSFAARVREAQKNRQPDEELLSAVLQPRGRPPYPISDEQREIILQAIREGKSYRQASKRAGILTTTLKSWLRMGGYPNQVTPSPSPPPNKRKEPYISFVRDVLAAEAEAARLVSATKDAA